MNGASFITQSVPVVVVAFIGGNAPPVSITVFWQAFPIVHQRDTNVHHRLSSFFNTPSRLKTLFSRVPGTRKPVPGLNPFPNGPLIGKFYTIFIELKILLVKHPNVYCRFGKSMKSCFVEQTKQA